MGDKKPKDPIKCAVWGLLVGNIETMGILPAQQGGEAIAKVLKEIDGDILEKMAEVDGPDNYEIIDKDGDQYVISKACPFREIYSEIPDWGDRAMALVGSYNKRADGGGALHPLCLVHKGIRKAMNAGIISLGCRSGATGKIELASHALEKVGLSEDEANSMLEDKACLFVIKKT